MSRPGLQGWRRIVQKIDQILLHPGRRSRRRSLDGWLRLLRPLLLQIPHAGHLGGSNRLSFFRRHVRVVVGTVRPSPAAPHTAAVPAAASAVEGAGDHLGRPQLEDFGHAKVRNPVDAQIEWLDLGHVPVGRLGDQVTPKGDGRVRDTEGERVLEDLIGRPTVLSALRVMDILPIRQDLTLPAVEGPGEDDLVLASAAVGPREALRKTFLVGNAELEGDLLLGEA
jgi:hypothetical protein